MWARIAASIFSRSASVTLTLVREVEVVVEAVLDRRPDRHLGPGVELLHRLGHHVGGVVADQLQRLGVAVGEDRDLGSVGERRREVAQLAVDRIASAALASPGPIAAAASAPRRATGSSSGLPSGSVTVIFPRSRLDPAMLPTPQPPLTSSLCGLLH